MATTYTGRHVTPTNMGVPSALDIAVSLGRECRWAGATSTWWSVLHHLYAMMEFARLSSDRNSASRDLRACILLHDAHESILRDVPSPWKTDAQREQEDALDERIWGAYLGSYTPQAVRAQCKRLDLLCMAAEGHVVAPRYSLYNAGLHLNPEAALTDRMAQVIADTLTTHSGETSSCGPGSPLVGWYVRELKSVVMPERWSVYGDHTNDPKPR